MSEPSAEVRPPLHTNRFRLGYADTDPAGILYYAAWFPVMERTQTEWFYLNGLRQDQIARTHGFWTATVRTECDYLVQVGLFDEITDELRVGRIGGGSYRLDHRMVRADGVVVARSSVTSATLSPEGRAIALPAEFRQRLESWCAGPPTPGRQPS